MKYRIRVFGKIPVLLACAGLALGVSSSGAAARVVVGVELPYYGPPAYVVEPPVYVPAPVYVPPPVYVAPPPPVYVAPPVQYVLPPAEPGPAPAQFWYYCNNPKGYYPYVTACPGGWRQVQPKPTQ
jgi:hypothetical protein